MKIAFIILVIVYVLHLALAVIWKTIAISCLSYMKANGLSESELNTYYPESFKMALLLFIL